MYGILTNKNLKLQPYIIKSAIQAKSNAHQVHKQATNSINQKIATNV